MHREARTDLRCGNGEKHGARAEMVRENCEPL
jgi:hypothetical protein